MEIITKSEEETQKFAKNYAKSLKAGDILALQGDLGCGKTAFTKGVASALGVSDTITSPTFVVAKEYSVVEIQNPTRLGQWPSRGRKSKLQIKSKIQITKLIHIDCYRIGEEDAEAVGLFEYLESKNNITVIEWPENIKSLLPNTTKYIKFNNLGGSKRSINF